MEKHVLLIFVFAWVLIFCFFGIFLNCIFSKNKKQIESQRLKSSVRFSAVYHDLIIKSGIVAAGILFCFPVLVSYRKFANTDDRWSALIMVGMYLALIGVIHFYTKEVKNRE